MSVVTIVGAGLAGCEAAWQLAKRGIHADLIDMKPTRMSAAHKVGTFAELVCSNSLKSNDVVNASGLLKEEMRLFDSLIIKAADATRVKAGGALAVDRSKFSEYVTNTLKDNDLITIISREVTDIPATPAIIATGPLTSEPLQASIARTLGTDDLHFFDAAAPIVTYDSIDMTRAFVMDRYNKGDGDYINCPLTKEEYDHFVSELVNAETARVHEFDGTKLFSGCQPVESIAKTGQLALAHGPMKPVGLVDPATGKRPYAVAQLRRETISDDLYNIVGFQTRLTFPEQRRVFGLIPALRGASFVRYGVMHRNTYINAPRVLTCEFEAKQSPGLFFAGQITGVEGYVPSAASGLMVGVHLAGRLASRGGITFPPHTAMGALARYISTPNHDYQPMGIQYGIIDDAYGKKHRDKTVERALMTIGGLR